MEYKYPESWQRQTPKGYEPYSSVHKLQDNEFVINDGLALKVFQDFCCNGCFCTSENNHKPSVNNLLETQTSFEE
jgi:hypothetical protein